MLFFPPFLFSFLHAQSWPLVGLSVLCSLSNFREGNRIRIKKTAIGRHQLAPVQTHRMGEKEKNIDIMKADKIW